MHKCFFFVYTCDHILIYECMCGFACASVYVRMHALIICMCVCARVYMYTVLFLLLCIHLNNVDAQKYMQTRVCAWYVCICAYVCI